jgi:predicted nucleic acid-binding protein
MATFVLDASVALSWCFPGDPTETTPYSRLVLGKLAISDAVVPEIWAFEVANSLFVSVNKRRRITEQQVQEYLRLLKALPIRIKRQSLWANVDLQSLAREQNLTAYDVAYLALASRSNHPLATSDEVLARAAMARGVELLG